MTLTLRDLPRNTWNVDTLVVMTKTIETAREFERLFKEANLHGDVTWLADGIPIAEREFRRDSLWDQPSRGFARLSVIDAKGKTASARVRVE